MENWLVQQLRFSAFVPTATPELLSSVWSQLSSEPPESEESRPREHFRRMAAPEEGSLIETVFLPGRFDIIKHPAAMAEIQPVIHFGDAKVQVSAFADRISALIKGLGDSIAIHRLAFGAVLIRPVASRELAYEELGKLLPVKIDPAGSRDFLYQINHPENFQISSGSIELNRLSRWSAMRTQHFVLQVAANGSGEPMPSRTGLSVGENFVRCEIDNSSAADTTDALAFDSLQPIFNRLIELAHVSANGECVEAS